MNVITFINQMAISLKKAEGFAQQASHQDSFEQIEPSIVLNKEALDLPDFNYIEGCLIPQTARKSLSSRSCRAPSSSTESTRSRSSTSSSSTRSRASF